MKIMPADSFVALSNVQPMLCVLLASWMKLKVSNAFFFFFKQKNIKKKEKKSFFKKKTLCQCLRNERHCMGIGFTITQIKQPSGKSDLCF